MILRMDHDANRTYRIDYGGIDEINHEDRSC